VLITSPVVTPAMIERLTALNAQASGLMVVADNPANVDALAAAAQKANKVLGVIVEFDVGQGRIGTKSFATEGGMPWVLSPKLAESKYKLMGDEHGGIDYDPKDGTLNVGDLVEFLTPHYDPTINLYDRYHVVRGDTLVDIWPVDARGC
jgi:D-serine deaminase-like pyridoxal phosphate-dependent protein